MFSTFGAVAAVPLCLVPCSLCLVPCALFLVPCSLFLVPCALCLVPCALCLVSCCAAWARHIHSPSTRHQEQGTCRRHTKHQAPRTRHAAQPPSTRNKARAAGTQGTKHQEQSTCRRHTKHAAQPHKARSGFEDEKAGKTPSEIIGVSRDEPTAIHRVCSDQDIGDGALRE